MNERIRGLWEQSTGASIPADGFYSSASAFNIAKFAELIVQECVGIALEQKKWVEDQEIFNPQDEQWNCARAQQSQRIVDKIKKHFGVE